MGIKMCLLYYFIWVFFVFSSPLFSLNDPPLTQEQHPEFLESYFKGKKDEILVHWMHIINQEKKDSSLTHSIMQEMEKYFLNNKKEEAGFLLGKLYIEGKKVSQDIDKGISYLQNISDQGFGDASFYLGKLFLDESFLPQEAEKGIYYLEKAVEQKNQKAASYLGILYTTGRFVEKNPEKAITYLKAASSLGEPAAKEIISFLEEKIADSQRKNQSFLDETKQKALLFMDQAKKKVDDLKNFLK